MAKAETRRKTARLPKQVELRDRRPPKTRRPCDLVVLDLRKAGGFTDYFVICSGDEPAADPRDCRRRHGSARGRRASSRRTSKATTARNGSCSTTSTSSSTSSRRRPRMFYGLERLWGNAERIDVDVAERPARRVAGGAGRRSRSLLAPAARCDGRSTSRRAARSAGAAGARSSRSRHRSATRCGDPLPSWRAASVPRRQLLHAAAARRREVDRGTRHRRLRRRPCARSSTR